MADEQQAQTAADTNEAAAQGGTKVDPAFGGQGIGSILVRCALEDLRSRGLQVIPECDFAQAWIDKHPDYADLLAAGRA